MKSGRPRRPGKALRNVGGEAPHIPEGLPGPPGPARHQKRTPKNLSQTVFRYPAKELEMRKGASLAGDLWMWLQLMWLQFEVVRNQVGVTWGRFGTGLGPIWDRFGTDLGPIWDRFGTDLGLQFGVVRSPVGVTWGRFGTGFGPFGPHTGPTSTPNDPNWTSASLKHEL